MMHTIDLSGKAYIHHVKWLRNYFTEAAIRRYFQNSSYIIHRKHLCWSLFLIKFLLWRTATLLKRDKCFPVNIAKFPGTDFFTEHLRKLLLYFEYYSAQKHSQKKRKETVTITIWDLQLKQITIHEDHNIHTYSLFCLFFYLWKILENPCYL